MSNYEEMLEKERALTDERKREVIERLFVVWKKAPELRLTQLIVNLGKPLYHVEDLPFIEELERFYDQWSD